MTPKKLRRIYEQDDDENKSPKELADEKSDIIFEDDDVLFLNIYSYHALKYYGPDKYKDEQYSNEMKTHGDKYLIIDKKGDKLSFYMSVPRYGIEYIEGYDGNSYSFRDIIDKFPSTALKILDITKNEDSHYGMLLRIKLGKQFDIYDVRRKTDNFIYDIDYSIKNPSKSMVVLNFNHDEYFNSFKFDDSIDRNLIDSAFDNRYSYGNEIFHYEDDEWTEGYMIRDFNESNMVLVKKILTYLNPGLLRKFSENDDDFWEQTSGFLKNTFDISGIIDEFTDLKNEGAYEMIKEYVINDFADIFQKYGIFRQSDEKPFNMYFTTVSRLLNLYKMVDDRSIPLVSSDKNEKTLFRTIGRKLGKFGGYYERASDNSFIDNDKFNNNIESILENIIEKIEENPELYNTEIAELYTQLEKLGYEIGNTYKLPTDNTKSFRIDDVDTNTKKIKIRHIGYTVEKRSYSIDEFKNYISTGELFERLVRKLKKLL